MLESGSESTGLFSLPGLDPQMLINCVPVYSRLNYRIPYIVQTDVFSTSLSLSILLKKLERRERPLRIGASVACLPCHKPEPFACSSCLNFFLLMSIHLPDVSINCYDGFEALLHA